jgi:hypothetical protein
VLSVLLGISAGCCETCKGLLVAVASTDKTLRIATTYTVYHLWCCVLLILCVIMMQALIDVSRTGVEAQDEGEINGKN